MEINELRILRTELEEDLKELIRARVELFRAITDVYPDSIVVNMFEVTGLDDSVRSDGIGSVDIKIIL